MSTIVLNSLNFVGNGILNGLNSFIERSTGVVNGFKYLNNRITLGDKTTVAWKLSVPVLVPEDSPCGCAGAVKYTNYVDISLRCDRATSAAERTAILTSIRDLVTTTNFGDSITSLVQTP